MRKLIATALLLASASFVACGGDSGTNPNNASIAGTYTLRTIGGASLPYAFQNGSASYLLVSDAITMADGGTWSEVYAYKNVSSGQSQTGSDNGSFSRSGAAVTLNSAQGTAGYTGSFDGASLQLLSGGTLEVFTK